MNRQNLSASVHQRLLNLRDESNQDFNRLLVKYALERLLYRISQSDYAHQFILKGALLFVAWDGDAHRPTQDMDLLGYGSSSIDTVKIAMQNICEAEVEPDGLLFDSESVTIQEIRENQEYESQRVQVLARLGNAKIQLQIDVGFGDIVTPNVQVIEYPVLLDFPKPQIRAYPPETVIAEKLQAMVFLGMQNSRMKDYYDLWYLAHHFSFDGDTVVAAICATFNRRETEIPNEYPVGLRDTFAKDMAKVTQWGAFWKRVSPDIDEKSLDMVIEDLRGFLGPPLFAAYGNKSLSQSWHPGGPWIRPVVD